MCSISTARIPRIAPHYIIRYKVHPGQTLDQVPNVQYAACARAQTCLTTVQWTSFRGMMMIHIVRS